VGLGGDVIAYFAALYLLWMIVIFRRLLTSSLPRPTDVAQLSVFFYNAPLALVATLPIADALDGYPIFLNTIAGDVELAAKTLALAVVACASLELGRHLGGLRLWAAKYHTSLRVKTSLKLQRNAALLCFGGLLTAFVGIAFFGVDSFFAGYAIESSSGSASEGSALIFFAYETIGLSAFIWLVCRHATGKRGGGWIVIISLTVIFTLTLIRGKRLELIIAMLPFILILWSTKLRSLGSRLAMAAFMVLAVSSMASFRFGEIPNAASLAFHIFSEGLYAGHVTPGLVEAVQTRSVPTEGGVRFLVAFAAMVPRFIFPAKDELIYQSLTDVSEFAPLGATSMLAEVYLQGGWFACVLFFGFVGVIGRKLEIKSLLGGGASVPIKTFLYIVFLCSFIPHFRDGIIPAIKIPYQLLIMLGFLFLISQVRLFKVRLSPTSLISRPEQLRRAPH
jgi:hypothetical protein